MRFIDVDTVTFTDINGKSYPVKDRRDISTQTLSFEIDIKEGDSETHIAIESVNTLEGIETVNGLRCAKIRSESTGTVDGKGKQEGIDLVTKAGIKGTDIWYFAFEEGIFVKVTS